MDGSFPATAECVVVDGEAEEEEVEEGSIPGEEDEGEDSCSTLIFLKALSAAKQIMANEGDILQWSMLNYTVYIGLILTDKMPCTVSFFTLFF